MQDTGKLGSDAIESMDRFHLNNYFLSIWKSRFLFGSALLLTLLAAYVFLKTTTPLYRIDAKVVIADEKKGESTGTALKELDFLNEQKIVDNEAEIIKSASIIGEVIKQLDLNTSYFFDTAVFKKVPVYYDQPVKISWLHPTQASLPLELRLSLLSDSTYQINDSIYVYGKPVDIDGVSFVVSKSVSFSAARVRKLIIRLQSDLEVLQQLKKGISISSPTKNSSILNISMLHPSQRKGIEILSRIIEEYTLANTKEKRDRTNNILRLIDDRLNLIASQLGDFENQEKSYKTVNRITNITDDSRNYLEKARLVDEKISQVSLQQAILNSIEESAKNINELSTVAGAGITDESLAADIRNLNSLKQERALLVKTVGASNPQLAAKERQIDEASKLVFRSIELQRGNLKTSLEVLSREKNEVDGLISTVPDNEKQLLQIVREKNIREGIYIFLLQKREEASLTNASAFSKMRVIDSPYSSAKPVKPNKLLIYGAALLAGFLIPSLMVSIRKELNTRVSNSDVLRKHFPNRFMGEIPKMKKFRYIADENNRLVGEHFRKLRTSIISNSEKDECPTVFVTSSVPSEGKTFCSINLAVSLANSGRRTLLLDLDLLNPKIAGIFNCQGAGSLNDYLAMKYLPGPELVQSVPEIPNLAIIPSARQYIVGGLPVARIEQLIKEMQKEFDAIVISFPPYRIVPDAIELKQFSSVTLVVFRNDYTPVTNIEKLKSAVQNGELVNVFVMNNAVPESELFDRMVLKTAYFRTS